MEKHKKGKRNGEKIQNGKNNTDLTDRSHREPPHFITTLNISKHISFHDYSELLEDLLCFRQFEIGITDATSPFGAISSVL